MAAPPLLPVPLTWALPIPIYLIFILNETMPLILLLQTDITLSFFSPKPDGV